MGMNRSDQPWRMVSIQISRWVGVMEKKVGSMGNAPT